jgi:hypothetical protein
MEHLSAKCLRSDENFFQLADYWEEGIQRKKAVSDFLEWVENNPEFAVPDTPEKPEEEDDLVFLTEEEAREDDVLITMNNIKRKLAAQFESSN